MLNSEIWKPICVFPKEYLVSNTGKVFSIRRKKFLKSTLDKDGYVYYVLCVNGKRLTIKAHRLVASAFIPNLENKNAIDHINGIRTDNRVENLKWVTNKENTHNPITYKKLINSCATPERLSKLYYASSLRDFGRKKCAVYKDGILIGIFNSQKEASEYTKVSIGKISQCVSGKKKSCKGYVFSSEVGDLEKFYENQ